MDLARGCGEHSIRLQLADGLDDVAVPFAAGRELAFEHVHRAQMERTVHARHRHDLPLLALCDLLKRRQPLRRMRATDDDQHELPIWLAKNASLRLSDVCTWRAPGIAELFALFVDHERARIYGCVVAVRLLEVRSERRGAWMILS